MHDGYGIFINKRYIGEGSTVMQLGKIFWYLIQVKLYASNVCFKVVVSFIYLMLA